MSMKIKRFEMVRGSYIEEIFGQSRMGYCMSDTLDFYDMEDLAKKGEYGGMTISFYDYDKGKIYQPFQRQKNVIYGKPLYAKNYFWFLQGDYKRRVITLFQYIPGQVPKKAAELPMAEIKFYNLRLVGENVCIISEEDECVCYYPKPFRFPMHPKENITVIGDEKVYLSRWVEEGWDDENNCAGQEYKYYEKVIVRDFQGNLLSETVGCLSQARDGSWWIS